MTNNSQGKESKPMSEKEIYERINQVDAKHERKNDELRNEMHSMLQTFHGHISDMTTSAAVLAERFKQMRIQMESMPKPEKRPCEFFVAHIAEHKENNTLWKRPFISGIVGAAFASLVIFGKGIWLWMKANI